MPILNQLLLGNFKKAEQPKPLNSKNLSQLLQILSSIVLLATPLPAQSLATLLSIHEDTVNHWIRNLHAVLNIPRDCNEPVRLLHKSFSDFLLGHEGTGTDSFRINAAETHAMLVLRCIQRMTSNNGPREDICNVRKPGKLRGEISKEIVADHIPPDLDYACLYWVFHLHQSGQRIINGGEVHHILHAHFLHWLETLSLIGKISESAGLIGILQSLMTVSYPM